MASNEDIMRVLGRLEGKVEQLGKDISEEKATAHQSRTSIHRRLDEQVATVALLDKTVAIHAEIDAQMRDKIETLTETVEKNHDAVAPTIEDMKRLKTLGYGFSGLIALAGISIASLLWWMGEAAAHAIRSWLKIP